MIKTPLSTVIGGAFWTPSATIIGSSSKNLTQLIKSLFSLGEQGFAYDPNDLSTMFQDAAGAVPVTAVGQPVGLIRDKSGRNNHAFQTTSASRPILRKNAVTGANYLEFDGSDDFLQTSNIDFTSTDKVSVFAGVRKSVNNGNYPVIAETGANATGAGSIHLFGQGTTGGKYALGIVGKTRVLYQTSTPYLPPISSVLTSFGDLSKSGAEAVAQRVNGVLQQMQPLDGSGTGGGNFENLPLFIACRAGVSNAFSGHIYGLIGVGKLTSDKETVDIEKELAKRVGVTLNV